MSQSDLEKLKKAILETNFDNPDHSANLNNLFRRYQKQLEEEKRWELESESFRSLWREEKYKREIEEREHSQKERSIFIQKYGIIPAAILGLSPLIIFGSIGLLLLSINDWWIVKFFLNILIFLFKLLSAILTVWANMIGIG